MKKMVLILFSMLAVFAFAACGNGADGTGKWSDFFAAANYQNYKVTIVSQSVDDGVEGEEYTSELYFDGKKTKSASGEDESYISEENGKLYIYEQLNDVWSKNEISESDVNISPYSFQFLKDGEQDFTLTDGYYVCKAEKFLTYARALMGTDDMPDGVTGTFKFKIADKKLSELVLEAEFEGDTLKQTMTFSDYGKATVTLPTVSDTGKWSDFFAADNYQNYKVTIETVFDGEDREISEMHLDGKKAKSVSGEHVSYLSEENGKMYMYMYDAQNKAWSKREISELQGNLSAYSFQFLKDGEQDFTLTDGYYVCKAETFLTYARALMGSDTLQDGVTGTFKFKIEDKKLSELVLEAEFEGETMLQTMTFSDYGNVTVTLPTVSETSAA